MITDKINNIIARAIGHGYKDGQEGKKESDEECKNSQRN